MVRIGRIPKISWPLDVEDPPVSIIKAVASRRVLEVEFDFAVEGPVEAAVAAWVGIGRNPAYPGPRLAILQVPPVTSLAARFGSFAIELCLIRGTCLATDTAVLVDHVPF
jgi:hypothetical protein